MRDINVFTNLAPRLFSLFPQNKHTTLSVSSRWSTPATSPTSLPLARLSCHPQSTVERNASRLRHAPPSPPSPHNAPTPISCFAYCIQPSTTRSTVQALANKTNSYFRTPPPRHASDHLSPSGTPSLPSLLYPLFAHTPKQTIIHTPTHTEYCPLSPAAPPPRPFPVLQPPSQGAGRRALCSMFPFVLQQMPLSCRTRLRLLA